MRESLTMRDGKPCHRCRWFDIDICGTDWCIWHGEQSSYEDTGCADWQEATHAEG